MFVALGYDFTNSVIPEKDSTVGDLLRISVVQSPTLAKAWNRFGNWCYKWGRTVVDKQNNLLTAADKVVIDGLIPSEVISKEDVYSILTRIKPPVDEEDIEVSCSRVKVERFSFFLQKSMRLEARSLQRNEIVRNGRLCNEGRRCTSM